MNFSFEKLRSIGVQKLGLGILCVILALVLIVMIFATAFIHDLVGKVSANGGDHIDGSFESQPWGFWVVIGISVIICAAIAIILYKKKMLK